MKFSSLRYILVVSIVLLGTQLISYGINASLNHITWGDMAFEGMNATWSDGSRRLIFVIQDGSGHSRTVQGAVDLVPEGNTLRTKIQIHPGIYRERVFVPRTKPYISFIGINKYSTVITNNTKASDKDPYGNELGTFRTATVEVQSDYFVATGITIQNTIIAVPGQFGMQAIALKISGDRAMFYQIGLLGSQDTLLDLAGTHYYYQSFILGSVDFICGNARSYFEECTLYSTARKHGAIAAHRRSSPKENTGFSFVNCEVNGTGEVYLGRAWGPYSRTIYSQCRFENIITPAGWHDWKDPSRRNTVTYGEYQCEGRGADTSRRVPWAKRLSYEEASPFLYKSFIDGQEWLRL